ncbi:unnamed protein product [Adineta steineri]|uniref:EF-hand domain-containing protein n=1 Tax=Adineta steineri TaxID=433720 RepID=A0A815WMY1_9BILA|nr:unnamed protein product [Adineta steineri]CAF1551185.1 unnamed protein product [Adineta steineri]
MSAEKNSAIDLRSEFNRLDYDKDGYITLKEFRDYHERTNKDGTAIEKAFAEIDADNDGMVTFEEFERAYKR